MTDVSDFKMRNYTKATDFNDGDEIELVDEGEWKEVDFSKAKDGSAIKTVFQAKIRMITGDVKEHSFNSTSLKSLSDAWGKDTAAWVGRPIKAMKVKQMSFGKLSDVLVFVPAE